MCPKKQPTVLLLLPTASYGRGLPAGILGASHTEQLRGNEKLTPTLSAVTAVVGVVLNLAFWFGWHVLFLASRFQGPIKGRALASSLLPALEVLGLTSGQPALLIQPELLHHNRLAKLHAIQVLPGPALPFHDHRRERN